MISTKKYAIMRLYAKFKYYPKITIKYMEKPPKIESPEKTFFKKTLDEIMSNIKEIESEVITAKEQLKEAQKRLELILNGKPEHPRDVNMTPEIREQRIKFLQELIELDKKIISDLEEMVISFQKDSNIMLEAADYIDQRIEMTKIDEMDDGSKKPGKLPN